MRFVWTLPVSSRCCWKKTWVANVAARSPSSPAGTRTTLTQPSRWEPGGGVFASCHSLSPSDSTRDFTQQGTGDTSRSATLRCVGGRLRNDCWQLGLSQHKHPSDYYRQKPPACPGSLVTKITIYGSFCALGCECARQLGAWSSEHTMFRSCQLLLISGHSKGPYLVLQFMRNELVGSTAKRSAFTHLVKMDSSLCLPPWAG